ncbi:DUF6221 family protein [Amycolatopsis sp. NPDC006131]|uniref:DUF6221 family protein n=1 Tax=Amycolatopsis sp. NPDC006131 TaxID=3156731 RepID=UPI0033A33997
MDDLIAFFQARLDDEQRLAEAVSRETTEPNWSAGDLNLSDYVTTAEHGNPVVVGPYSGFMSWEMRQYIALHDPARALEDVAAKRRVIEAYEKVVFEQKVRANHPGEDLASMQQALRHAIKILALPHAAHPDYCEVWRP